MNQADRQLFRQLWPFVRPHRRLLLLSLLLLPVLTLAEAGQPFLVRHILDGPIKLADGPGLVAWTTGFLGLLLATVGLRSSQTYLAQIAGERIIFDLRVGLYQHLQKLTPRFYHHQPIGKLVTRLTSDIEALSEMFSSGGLAILTDVAMIAGALVGMYVMHPPLALYTSLMLPVLLWLMGYFRRKSREANDHLRTLVAQLNAFLQENLSGMDVVRLTRRETRNLQDFEGVNRQVYKTGVNQVFFDCTFTALVEAWTNLALVLVLWLGALMIGHGDVSFGLLLAFFWFVQMLFKPIEDVSEKYTMIQGGLAAIAKILPVFEETPEVADPAQPVTPTVPIAGAVQFSGVGFAYRPDVPVLHDMTASVQPGQTVAIVGASGAGKTTLMKLLTRQYDVSAGAILLDGIDIRRLPLATLRRHIVVIQQDDFVFSRSILENITLDPTQTAPTPQIEAIVRQVHAERFVQRLGYGAVLQERGRNLSAGERQLLMFARAMAHNPPILVLDEATAAVDGDTERDVQAAMDTLMQGRTVFVIAHRLSTLQNADQIWLVDGGRIAERGTHGELLALGGRYAHFYQQQQQALNSRV